MGNSVYDATVATVTTSQHKTNVECTSDALSYFWFTYVLFDRLQGRHTDGVWTELEAGR